MKLLQKPKDGDDILRKSDIDVEKLKKEIYDKVLGLVDIDQIKRELASRLNIEQFKKDLTNQSLEGLLNAISSKENVFSGLIPSDGVIQGGGGIPNEQRFNVTVNPITKMGIIHMDFICTNGDEGRNTVGFKEIFTIPSTFPYLPATIYEHIIDMRDTGTVWTNENSPSIKTARIQTNQRYIVDLVCFFKKK